LVALRSLSLKPFSFGYKTPPIRFSQAGGQSAHKARPPNLELALTPLARSAVRSRLSTALDAPVIRINRPVQSVFYCRARALSVKGNIPHLFTLHTRTFLRHACASLIAGITQLPNADEDDL